MKKFLALIVLLFAVFLFFNRHRVYIRDPFGTLTRGGVPESGAQIFINADNDVLIENDTAPMYLLVVQHTQIGEPARINCAHWIACMADADTATLLPQANVQTPTYTSSKELTFLGPNGVQAVVKIR